MLAIPEYGNRLKILSIDPGTTTTGLACFDFDLVNCQTQLVDALTIKASTNFGKYKQISLNHYDSLARIIYIADTLATYLYSFRPDIVICESSYMGSYADAFAAGVHCLSIFELTVMQYNERMPLEVIDPTSVKKNIGAILRGEETKNSVREKILGLCNSGQFFTNLNLTVLDEHAIDAIAIGWYKITKLIEGYYELRYHHHKNSYCSFDYRIMHNR